MPPDLNINPLDPDDPLGLLRRALPRTALPRPIVPMALPTATAAPAPVAPSAPAAIPKPIGQPSGMPTPLGQRLGGAQQRYENLADNPPQYHGFKRFADTVANLFPIGRAIESAAGIGTQGYLNRLGAAQDEMGTLGKQSDEESQRDYRQAETDKVRQEVAAAGEPKPKEEQWSVIPGMTDEQGRVLQEEKNSGTLRWAPDISGVGPVKQPTPKNTKEQLQAQLVDAENKGDKATAAKLRQQLKDIDPLGEQRVNISVQSQTDKEQKAADKAKQLTPAAAKVMMDTAPAKDQVDELLAKLEAVKDNNTPGYYFWDRAKYMVGMDSDGGDIEKSISQLELNRILAGARLLKGGSRSYQALQKAMVHAPDTWKDSPKLMYNKLKTIQEALQQVEDEAQKYGTAGGGVQINTSENPQGAGGATVSFKVGNDIYDVPPGKVKAFKLKYPNAQQQ